LLHEGGLIVNSCTVRFADRDVRAERGAIRWELFLDWNIRDVVLTDRSDTLRILFRDSPAQAAWLKLLTDAGYPEPSFGSVKDASSAEPMAA
jgi:hypothetical protein